MVQIITKRTNLGGYEQIIKYIQETKNIFFIDCNCPNFTGIVEDKDGKQKLIGSRRIKTDGKFSDTKYYSEPCKHLLPDITVMEMQGGTLKRPKPMIGTDKCTAELRRFLMERSFGICEVTDCKAKGDEVHRKIPRTNQGKYNKTNCVLLCKPHHQAITFQKWQNSPGAKR